MPRRLALDETKKEAICAILSVGCTRQVAAQYVGCHTSTIIRTAQRDKAFRERLAQSEAAFEALHLKNIHAAGKDHKNWRASVWLLERIFPDRYAKRRPRTLTIDQVRLLLEQFAEILVQEVPAEFRGRLTQKLSDLRITNAEEPRAMKGVGHAI